MRQLIGAFLFFGCTLYFGYRFVLTNTESPNVGRDPASIPGNLDFSGLSGEPLRQAISKRLLEGFDLKKDSQGARIALGHFIMTSELGEKKMGCDEFSRVILTFSAEGSSVSGEQPQMEIESKCEYSSDFTKINPIRIPIAKIIGEKPADGEFQFSQDKSLVVRFTNIPDSWPHLWLLKSVKLTSEKNYRDIVLDAPEVIRKVGHPLVVTF